MNYENLHTSSLEKLFGTIKFEILKQDDTIRIIKLLDGAGTTRTLGIVRFFNINLLPEVHDKILSGQLLGKTLCDSNIDFDKGFMGSVKVSLPQWLRDDFKSEYDVGLAFYSKIFVLGNRSQEDKFLYSELIEIIPLEIKEAFLDKVNSKKDIYDNINSLLKEANIEIIKSDFKI